MTAGLPDIFPSLPAAPAAWRGRGFRVVAPGQFRPARERRVGPWHVGAVAFAWSFVRLRKATFIVAATIGLARGKRASGAVELTIAAAVIGILGTFALPSYADSVRRNRILEALVELSSFGQRMEQIYHDTGRYGAESCAAAVPKHPHFTFDCTLANGGQGFSASAVGKSKMAGYAYSIDESGRHATNLHPRSVAMMSCWSIGGKSCG